MVLYSLSFAFELLNFSETLKQGGKVFFEMVKSHRAMNPVGAQQMSWMRMKGTPAMAKVPCPNGFIPQDSGIRSLGHLNCLPWPSLHHLEGGTVLGRSNQFASLEDLDSFFSC